MIDIGGFIELMKSVFDPGTPEFKDFKDYINSIAEDPVFIKCAPVMEGDPQSPAAKKQSAAVWVNALLKNIHKEKLKIQGGVAAHLKEEIEQAQNHLRELELYFLELQRRRLLGLEAFDRERDDLEKMIKDHEQAKKKQEEKNKENFYAAEVMGLIEKVSGIDTGAFLVHVRENIQQYAGEILGEELHLVYHEDFIDAIRLGENLAFMQGALNRLREEHAYRQQGSVRFIERPEIQNAQKVVDILTKQHKEKHRVLLQNMGRTHTDEDVDASISKFISHHTIKERYERIHANVRVGSMDTIKTLFNDCSKTFNLDTNNYLDPGAPAYNNSGNKFGKK